MPPPTRLNLGCGSRKLPGHLNVDKAPGCEPDQIVDLESFPWPFADSSAEHVVLHHTLEHLGADTQTYLDVIRELYRVCAPGATVDIRVPHPRHDDFLSDPTHVRAVTPQGLLLFSKAQNRKWQQEGRPNTPLGLYLDVDFEIVKADYVPSETWRRSMKAGRMSQAQFTEAAHTLNNVVQEIHIVLKAVKPAS
jgi:hypothetical protein